MGKNLFDEALVVYYLDTSAWIAWKFVEPGKDVFMHVSLGRDQVFSSPLLAAEYVAYLKRSDRLEKTDFSNELSFVQWVYPAESLLSVYPACVKGIALRGADLYHLATAYWFADTLQKEVSFLSCDKKQRQAARLIGFRVP